MTRHPRHPRDDGQVALLVLVSALVAAALVLVAAAATQVHLAHQQLRALADAAALHAAEAVDEQGYYSTGTRPGQDVPVSAALVRREAGEDVAGDVTAAGPAGRLVGLAVADPTGSPDGRTAEVTLTATVRPWLAPRSIAGIPTSVPLSATSRARAGLVAP